MMDDDEIRAMESRLRTSGWTSISNRQSTGLTKAERKVKAKLNGIAAPKSKSALTGRKDTGFGELDTKVRSVAKWLVAHEDEVQAPIYSFITRKFGVSYDDAVRAVGEAERIIGSRGE